MSIDSVLGHDRASQGTTLLSDGSHVDMPLLTKSARSFAAVFGISYARAAALMPTSAVRPIVTIPGRSLAVVQVMEYLEKSIQPYREFTISIPVRRDSSVPIPVYDLVQWARSRSGIYITHIGVDNQEAKIVGREVLGFPKVIADIELVSNADEHIAEVNIDGDSVLTLAVNRAAKRGAPTQRQLDFYCHSLSPIDNRLFHIPYQSESLAAFTAGRHAGRLHLGTHPIAQEIRDLGIADAPRFSLDITQYALVSNLPDGYTNTNDWRDPRDEYRRSRAESEQTPVQP